MKTYVAVDKDGTEIISNFKPVRRETLCWGVPEHKDNNGSIVEVPKGTIYKLIGMNMNWYMEPRILKEML